MLGIKLLLQRKLAGEFTYDVSDRISRIISIAYPLQILFCGILSADKIYGTLVINSAYSLKK